MTDKSLLQKPKVEREVIAARNLIIKHILCREDLVCHKGLNSLAKSHFGLSPIHCGECPIADIYRRNIKICEDMNLDKGKVKYNLCWEMDENDIKEIK